MYRYLTIIAGIVLLSACAGPQVSPGINSYTIAISGSTDSGAVEKPLSDKTLKVSMPDSSSAIMSRNILYQEKDYALNAYAYNKWSDTPNRMLGNLLISSIRKSNAFRVVLPIDSRGKSDYILESSLYEFQQHIKSNIRSEAVVRIMFYLINNNNGDVIASRELSAKVAAATVDVKGGVGAMNKSANLIATRLNEWLLSLEIR